MDEYLLFPKGLSQALKEFSDKLVPSREYYRQAGESTDEIFTLLRSRGDVDRCVLGGSMGKRTAITTENIPGAGISKPPDVDVVLFLNKKLPPFKSVVQEFVQAFENAESRGVDIQIKNDKDPNFVCVLYKGYSFDVAPAPNLSPNVVPKERHQRTAVMEIIADSDNKREACRAYGSALAESAVDFMRRQQNAHPLIRLAKFWNSRIKMPKYVFARSYLIECVALDAYDYGQSEGWNLIQMFKHFLRSMSNFDEMFINVGESSILRDLRDVRPLIVDPINPYNNLGQQHYKVKQEFQRAARTTLAKWRDERIVINSWKELIQLLSPEDDDELRPYSSYPTTEAAFDERPSSSRLASRDRPTIFTHRLTRSTGVAEFDERSTSIPPRRPPSPELDSADSSSSGWSTAQKIGAGVAAVGLLFGAAALFGAPTAETPAERAERERRERGRNPPRPPNFR